MTNVGRTSSCVMGVDGGGTKTRAVILDQQGNLLGTGNAGPSNPLRVGSVTALQNIGQAVDEACDLARVRRRELRAVQIGLAGVRKLELRESLAAALRSSGLQFVAVVTDADIALYGATDGAPGLVVIAGTGSVCCGVNARKRRACAGGWGPLIGDEGGGAWIARRALQRIAWAADGRGPATQLSKAACEHFRAETALDLSTVLYAPGMTNERIAGFARAVIERAQAGDKIAVEVIKQAGAELGNAACAVILKLGMKRSGFHVAHVGSIFRAGELLLGPLRRAVRNLAPSATVGAPRFEPAVAAARMAARRHVEFYSTGSKLGRD